MHAAAAADARSTAAQRLRALAQHADELLDALPPTPAMAADVPLQADPRAARGRALGARAEAPVRSRRSSRCMHYRRRARGGRRPVNGTKRPLAARRDKLLQLSERIGAMADMDFGFLYDPARDLLSIGYNVDDRRLDAGYYDLLASEVRLASFVAISSGQIPQASWFALGRQLATARRQDGAAVVERLDVRVPDADAGDAELREHAARRDHAGRRGAAGALRTPARRALGHLRIGLQHHRRPSQLSVPGVRRAGARTQARSRRRPGGRALRDDDGVDGRPEGRGAQPGSVSRPRASPARTASTRRSTTRRRGCRAARRARSFARTWRTTRAWALLALAYLLLDRPMQRRFESDRALQATLLLLQERVPRAVPFHPEMTERVDFRSGQPTTETPLRVIATPHTPSPEVQLLSNGRYHVMLTNSGAGYSRWKDVAVTRWREDGTTDAWGSFCYLRDTETGTFWSTTPQPTLWPADSFEAIFSEGRAEFRRRDQGIDAYTEVVVSPEDDIELRRLRLTNRSRSRRSIEFTTYTEVVMAPATADAVHPAFSKLFVQTEVLDQPSLILCSRRPRSAEEQPPWMFHLVAVHGAACGAGVARDRPRRASSAVAAGSHAPAAMRDAAPLSGTSGSVLDPIAATRRVITLEPEQTALVDIVYGAADTRDACLALAHKAMDRRLADRVFELAWTHSQVILRQLNASEADAQMYRPARQHRRLLAADACAPRPPCCCATGAANRACGGMRFRATCRSCCCRSAMPPASSSCGRWCRRTPGGASRGWPSTWSSGTRSATSTASGCRSRCSA